MSCLSKVPPEILTESCQVFVHPWTKNCLQAIAYTFGDSFLGSNMFFAFLNLGQFASTVLKKKRKVTLREFLQKQLRSSLFGASMSTFSIATHCFLRHFLQKYYPSTLILIPSTVGGFSCLIETRKNVELYVNAFANCALEFIIRQLEHSKILNWTPNVQTFIFMVVSSLLSFLFNFAKFDLNYFWFFIPPKGDKTYKEGVCLHNENCKKYIFNLFLMYSTTGFLLQSIRSFLRNIKNPTEFLSSLTKAKTYKLAMFLSGYAVIYQAIRCFLYQKEKKSPVTHDAIAGFLAGAAFRFQPTLPILNSAVITIIQILGQAALRQEMIPNLPYSQLLFALLSGFMFQARIFHEEQCPSLMIYIMSTVTHGLSDRCTQIYKEYIQNLKLSNTS